MRLRFKLRTLLVATALIAAMVGLSIDPVLNVSREREALKELASEWNVERLNDRAYSWSELGWIERCSNWVDQKLSGIASQQRCRGLVLSNKSAKSITTMGRLPRLKYVSSLTLQAGRTGFFSFSATPRIDINEYRNISKMRNLNELTIEYPVPDQVIEDLKSLNISLLRLTAENWTQASFDSIAEMQSLERLHLKADGLSRENLESIGSMEWLQSLTLWTSGHFVINRKPGKAVVRLGPPIDIEPIGELPNLKWLSLNGHIETLQFDALAQLESLEILDLEYTDVGDNDFESLLKLETRPELLFGKLQISSSTYTSLKQAGFKVSHNGLIKDRDQWFLHYDGVNYEIEPVGTNISAHILWLEDLVTWRFVAKIAIKENENWSSAPAFRSPPFQFKGDWRELVSKTAEVNYRFGDEPEGSLNIGTQEDPWTHVKPEKNQFRFVSRSGNRIRMQGDFHANSPVQGDGIIDAMLPFEIVEVEVSTIDWENEAKEILGQHFDVTDFEEPKLTGRGGVMSRARFRLKESLRIETDPK